MLANIVQKKILRLQLVTFILLGSIGGKLCYSQISLHNDLLNKAEDLWERSFPLEAARGYISDRNGVKLAINLPVISVVCIPYQVEDAEYQLDNEKITYYFIYSM